MALQQNEYNSKTGEHTINSIPTGGWWKGRKTEREARAAEYDIHLDRMATDPEYKKNWERNEADFKEAMAKHNI
jgi:hypothetical protein